MRSVFIFILLTQLLTSQTPQTINDVSPLVVLKFSWERSRLEHPGAERYTSIPTASSRPGAKTTEEQSAELRSVEIDAARDAATRPVVGYLLKVKIKNMDTKMIRAFFWEHQSRGTRLNEIVRRQFFCGIKLKAGRDSNIEAFSPSMLSGVVNAKELEKSSSHPNETIVVNRIEYSDGSIWQRPEWRLPERVTIPGSRQPEWTRIRGCVDLSRFIRK
jgi:hypothetical protein